MSLSESSEVDVDFSWKTMDDATASHPALSSSQGAFLLTTFQCL